MSDADLRVQVVGARDPVRTIEVEVALRDQRLVRHVEAREEVVIYFPTLPDTYLTVYVRGFDAEGQQLKCAWRIGRWPDDLVPVDLTTADVECFPAHATDAGPDTEPAADAADADPAPPGRGPPDSSMGRGPDKRH